jgi:hypothetical protein
MPNFKYGLSTICKALSRINIAFLALKFQCNPYSQPNNRGCLGEPIFFSTTTWELMPEKFLSIVGQDPSDSKSSWSHVDILHVLLFSFEEYSICSSKITGNSHEVSNFNRLFLNLNQFNCN